jgi:hypothetical protein
VWLDVLLLIAGTAVTPGEAKAARIESINIRQAFKSILTCP